MRHNLKPETNLQQLSDYLSFFIWTFYLIGKVKKKKWKQNVTHALPKMAIQTKRELDNCSKGIKNMNIHSHALLNASL